MPEQLGIVADDAVVGDAVTGGDVDGASSPDDASRLVDEALEKDKRIRQWVVTASIQPRRLVERIREDDLYLVAAQQRADLVESEQRLSSLTAEEASRTRKPFYLRLLRWYVVVMPLLLAADLALFAVIGAITLISFVTLGIVGAVAVLEVAVIAWRSRGEFQFRSKALWRYKSELNKCEEAVRDAQARLQEAVLEESVKPALYKLANENRLDLYRTKLSVVEHEGLAEVEQLRLPIDTDAKRCLDYLLREMPGGSIGLAGPRGAGKSTLMRAACPATRSGPIFGVVVAAPVQFGAREFVLHLFAEICRTVLGRDVVDELRRPDPISERTTSRRALVQAAAVAAMLAVVAGIGMLVTAVLPTHSSAYSQAIWGAILANGGLFGYFLALRYARMERFRLLRASEDEHRWSDREDSPDFELARVRLQDIWFQQTYTTGWSGSLKLPIGVEGGIQGTTELARQQMSMPDIVGELRRLIETIASREVSVRIGIDELDKIDSPKDANTFMNEVKVLFGIPNCFFLVSVSEDAMSTFERRGLPFRDVFDSSFDDIVRVGHLEAEAAIELVQGRVIGMPTPFILLGHCMAGGLARDLIRVARDMVSINAERREDTGLSEICHQLVRTDIKGKAEASVIACRRLPRDLAVEELQSWFRRLSGVPIEVASLLALCSEASSSLAFLTEVDLRDSDGRSPSDLATEFLAFCFFSATLLEFFVDDRSAESFHDVAARIDGHSSIDRLAEARQAFAVHPHATWDAVSAFRDQQKMERVPAFPRLA